MKITLQNLSGAPADVQSAGVDFVLAPGVVSVFPGIVSVGGTNYTSSGSLTLGVQGPLFVADSDPAGLFFMGLGLGLAMVATAVSFSFVRSIGGARQSWTD